MPYQKDGPAPSAPSSPKTDKPGDELSRRRKIKIANEKRRATLARKRAERKSPIDPRWLPPQQPVETPPADPMVLDQLGKDLEGVTDDTAPTPKEALAELADALGALERAAALLRRLGVLP